MTVPQRAHTGIAQARRRCAQFPWSPTHHAQRRSAVLRDRMESAALSSRFFARGMSMTRVIALMSLSWQEVPFTALELLSSIALERFGVAAGWPAILRRRRSAPSSISPAPLSVPSSPHVRSPVQIPCARPRTYVCFRACLAMHSLTVVLSRLPATGVIPSKLAAQSRRRWHTAANRVALQFLGGARVSRGR